MSFLTASTLDIISRQATINIGTIGHVAHGKSTVVKQLTGIKTSRFCEEQKQNKTIKLGYANAKIYECDNLNCPRPNRYRSMGSKTANRFPCDRQGCGGQFQLVRHVSFVDCPGHEDFMAAMLSGVTVMDAALMIIAADQPCPQPQTYEHLAAVNIMGLKSWLILQNKIDRVEPSKIRENYREIHDFIQNTNAENSPIIPISAQFGCNMDIVCEYIVQKIPMPIRDLSSKPRMTIIRSFDINKPGTDVSNLKGGIAGGSICRGILKVSQDIEIRPGLIFKDNSGAYRCRPLRSKILSLYAEQNQLELAIPGGLIGVGTKLDPVLCRSDRLVGHILGEIDQLPKMYIVITIRYYILRRLSDTENNYSKRATQVSKLRNDEVLLLNIGSQSMGGRVLRTKPSYAEIQLFKPVCADINEKLAISRRINGPYQLIGWGELVKGKEIVPEPQV